MLGPVLMAYQTEEEIERLLEKSPLTATAHKSFTTKQQYKEWLGEIQRQGFVVEDETAFEGIGGVAAPIRDFSNRVIASVGIGFISSSVDSKTLKRIIKEVTDMALVISRELGFTGQTR